MNRLNPTKKRTTFEQLMIWSILNQGLMAHYVRLLVGGGVAIAGLMGMARIISLDAALRLIFYGGLAFSCMLWVFIQKRRTWLLTINDPDLKREAYIVMLAYLKTKGYRLEGKSAAPEPKRAEREQENCTTC